ncbi:acyl carrier protein [Streptomyces fradiae]|uniref:acyl carrier protein n=1 Tax=Streptomyces fradiae TaxID=1906 RepID=UPI003516F71F
MSAGRTATEVVAGSWERHAGLPPEADSNFFADGGTSVGMIRLVQDVQDALGVALEFADVYAAGTYAELCALVDDARRAASGGPGHRPVGGPA